MITQPKNVYMSVPAYKVDQIIGVKTGSFSVAAATAVSNFKTATDTFDTGFGDSCFFQGIFSTDGGLSWNDFGVYRPNLTTPAQPVFQTVSCFGYVTSTGVFTAVGINWWDLVHATSSAYTIQYKVAFIAKDTQGAITPIKTNETFYYSSKYNYQKIFTNGSFANSGANTVVAHNLGYIPKIRVFINNTNSTLGSEGVFTVPANSMMTADWFYFATNIYSGLTNATFTPVKDNIGTITGTVFYRIYLDS